eukprot:SAG11_NODE_2382_length_3425_cov_2.571257_2_plen_130_part_00
MSDRPRTATLVFHWAPTVLRPADELTLKIAPRSFNATLRTLFDTKFDKAADTNTTTTNMAAAAARIREGGCERLCRVKGRAGEVAEVEGENGAQISWLTLCEPPDLLVSNASPEFAGIQKHSVVSPRLW